MATQQATLHQSNNPEGLAIQNIEQQKLYSEPFVSPPTSEPTAPSQVAAISQTVSDPTVSQNFPPISNTPNIYHQQTFQQQQYVEDPNKQGQTVTFAQYTEERIIPPTTQQQYYTATSSNDQSIDVFPRDDTTPKNIHVHDMNQQEAIIRMTDPTYLWHNHIIQWCRFLLTIALWITFIILMTNVKHYLSGFNSFLDVDGLTTNTAYGYDVASKASIVTGFFGSVMILVKIYEAWKPKFSFDPVIAVIDLTSFITLMWTIVIYGGLTLQPGYRRVMEHAAYHACVILILFAIQLAVIAFICNVMKLVQKQSIDKKRRLVIEGKLTFTPNEKSELARQQDRPTRTSTLYLRSILFFLSWAIFCFMFATKIEIIQLINVPYFPITAYTAVSNMIVCSGVIGSLLVVVLILDFAGISWIGGLLDLFFISSWIAFLIDFGANPLSGVYWYANTFKGPIPSAVSSALTFTISGFTKYYAMTMFFA